MGKPFTEAHDRIIIKCVLREPLSSQLGINDFWNRCASKLRHKGSKRHADTIRIRLLKRIVPAIDSYSFLTDDQKREICEKAAARKKGRPLSDEKRDTRAKLQEAKTRQQEERSGNARKQKRCTARKSGAGVGLQPEAMQQRAQEMRKSGEEGTTSVQQRLGFWIPKCNFHPTIMTCRGCKGKFEISTYYSYQMQTNSDMQAFYVHCLFKCAAYKALDRAKKCAACGLLFLNGAQMDMHVGRICKEERKKKKNIG